MRVLLLVLILGLHVCLCEKLITNEFVEELKKKVTWNVINPEKNKFRNKTVSEFRQMLRVKKPDKKFENKEIHRNLQNTILPTNFDGREKWGSCIHSGRDQGKCGACWAFGTTNFLSDRFCIRGKDVLLSPQNLMECDHYDECCDGADMKNVYRFLTETGVVEERCRFYDMKCGKCRKTNCAHYKCKPKTMWESSDNQLTKLEIYNNGPVQGIYDVYSDFANYDAGIYYHTSGEFLGVHAVEVLGWGVEDGMKYWLCKNEWGDDWGDIGVFKIKMGECGIDDYMSTCEPLV